MFKRKADDTYAFSARFWTYVAIASALIVFIGWKTQTTANRTEQLSRETIAYAAQTQDCLNQLQRTLVDRSAYTAPLNAIQDRLNDNQKRWNDLWGKFIIDLVQIPTNQPQSERDIQAAPIIAKFVGDINSITTDRATILKERSDTIAAQASKPIPDPHCGDKLPGH